VLTLRTIDRGDGTVLVPLTDRSNPYSSMMLELIADQTPYPSSPLPRRFDEAVRPSVRPGRGVGAVIASVAVIAVMIAFVAALRAMQS
jgi:hypothetical protein